MMCCHPPDMWLRVRPVLLSTLKPAVARIFLAHSFFLISQGGFVNLISSLKAPPIVPNRWNPGYGSFGPRTWLSGPMGPCMWLIG